MTDALKARELIAQIIFPGGVPTDISQGWARLDEQRIRRAEAGAP